MPGKGVSVHKPHVVFVVNHMKFEKKHTVTVNFRYREKLAKIGKKISQFVLTLISNFKTMWDFFFQNMWPFHNI